MKTKYTKKQITEAIAYWKKQLEKLGNAKIMNESWGYTIDDLRGIPYESFASKKNPPSYERWQAAQLPDPEEDVHGRLASASVLEMPGERDYLKKFQVYGVYPDGVEFQLGPLARKVCSEYISLHSLSKNSREYARLKDDGFDQIKVIDKKPTDEKLPAIYDIVKLPQGFYLKLVRGSMKIGPFSNKQLARMYAMDNELEMQKGEKNDAVEKVLHIEYPTWLFTYKMRGIECADIVTAETPQAAMKIFDFQWHVFDNSRPFKDKFNTLAELQRDLSLLKIKDVKMEKLDKFNAEELFDTAEDIGNPSEKPELMKFCKNPRFRYILGIDMKTGRSPVKIVW